MRAVRCIPRIRSLDHHAAADPEYDFYFEGNRNEPRRRRALFARALRLAEESQRRQRACRKRTSRGAFDHAQQGASGAASCTTAAVVSSATASAGPSFDSSDGTSATISFSSTGAAAALDLFVAQHRKKKPRFGLGSSAWASASSCAGATTSASTGDGPRWQRRRALLRRRGRLGGGERHRRLRGRGFHHGGSGSLHLDGVGEWESVDKILDERQELVSQTC